MTFSIEGRLPFLDYRLVEFSVGLPSNFKIRGGWSKWILRYSMNDRFLPEIAWRKRKIGFEAPKSVWTDGVIAHTWPVVHRSELLRKNLRTSRRSDICPTTILRQLGSSIASRCGQNASNAPTQTELEIVGGGESADSGAMQERRCF